MAVDDRRMIDRIFGPDPIGAAYAKHGLTMDRLAELDAQRLEVCAKSLPAKMTSKNVAVVREVRETANQIRLIAGWKAPEKKEVKLDLNRPLTDEEEEALREAMKEDG